MSLFQHKQHEHVIQNINQLHDNQLTIGERIADAVAAGMGSWKFIIIQTIIVILWIILNIWLLTHPFDAWPFILLNLVFSTQAAYASPLILMSSNRQAAKDRLSAEEDYNVNRKGEHEIEQMLMHLDKQDETIMKIAQHTETMMELLQKKQRASK